MAKLNHARVPPSKMRDLGLDVLRRRTCDLPRPFEMTDSQARTAALDKQARRKKAEVDQLSPERLKQLDQVEDEYWTDAVALVEGLMERFQRTVDESLGGNSLINCPVAFTQGRSLALTGMLARLWTNQKVADHFSDERMALLEERIVELEMRSAFEDVVVWAEDKSYRRGHGVMENGSLWIAKRNTTFGERPGACDAWRIALKQGATERMLAHD